MKRLPPPVLAIATAVMLVACSSAVAPSAPPAALGGHTYLSTDLQGAALVPGTRIRLAFTDGSLNANGGCNTMGGTYSIDGNRLTTTQMFMTEMGCDEPRMQQDEWLARFLGSVTFNLDGNTLTLTDGTIRLTLLDQEVATPDQPLEGTHWVLDGTVSGDAVSSVPVGMTASIRIANGRVDVEPGCNNGGGTIQVTAETLTFGPIALSKKACEAGTMTVESAVIAVLSGAAGYAIDADVLTLDAGEAGLISLDRLQARDRILDTLPTDIGILHAALADAGDPLEWAITLLAARVGRLRTARLADLTNRSAPAARAELGRMTRAGWLEPHGATRSRWYAPGERLAALPVRVPTLMRHLALGDEITSFDG